MKLCQDDILLLGFSSSPGITLFALGIFLVGSRHEAFSRHVLLYTEFANLDGVTKGSKVQVAGMDAGQVAKVDVPNSPNGRFRVQMKVDEQFHGLVRTDSVVTVDTEGVVGNTFLTIHTGSPSAAIAQADSILQSKPPVTISDLLTNGLGVMNDADATMKQVGGKLNVVLDGANDAIGNANDLLVGLKEGHGPAGMLLRDEKVADQIRETIIDRTIDDLELEASVSRSEQHRSGRSATSVPPETRRHNDTDSFCFYSSQRDDYAGSSKPDTGFGSGRIWCYGWTEH